MIATIFPSAMSPAPAAIGSSQSVRRPCVSASQTLGPQTGQAIGWAWNRRLAGSPYSAAQAGHISNADIVVFGRSYGIERTML